LSRRLHETDLRSNQEGFPDWLVDLAATEKVDPVVVAADSYGRASQWSPSSGQLPVYLGY
jgi:hypothetical protein